MNNKATKASLFNSERPPLLNLSDNRPHVDPTFRYFEHQNSPFINEMIMPLYIKEYDEEYIFDKYGNKYSVQDGGLYKNDKRLFDVNEEMFVRERIEVDYFDFDYYNDTLFYSYLNDDNSITINDKHTTEPLYTQGHILAHRLVALSETLAVEVVIYNNGQGRYIHVAVIKDDSLYEYDRLCTFYRQEIRLNTNYSWQDAISDADIGSEEEDVTDPIINIALVSDDTIGISAVDSYGTVLNTKYHGFATYFLDLNYLGSDDLLQIGSDIYPDGSSTTSEITVEYTTTIRASRGRTQSTSNKYCVTTNGTTFYEYDNNTIGAVINFPSNVVPTNTGSVVTVGGINYNLYRYNKQRYTYRLTASVMSSNDTNPYTWKLSAECYDGTVLSSEDDSTISKTLEFYREYWANETPLNTSAAWKDSYTIHIYNTDYVQTQFNSGLPYNRYEQQTATITALTYPTVVCDNGNLYSFYGFEQNTIAWTYRMSQGSVLIESGRFNGIFDNVYKVIALESHTVDSVDICRSNSFALNQNLVQQSVRLCNNSCALPNSETNDNSSSTSYIEYTNSNAYDLTYGAGSSSNSQFNYYGAHTSQTATSGKTEDYQIFNVQGMRVPVKNNCKFNLLYNTLLDTSCLIQGISYSNTEDEMGTLVAAWTSIDDDSYVVAGSNFIIYRDKSNAWWKISVIEGTKISALLDDRYILVNTTSYLNMYDSQAGKILHYATDYNNRLIFGSKKPKAWSGYVSGSVTRYVRATATSINGAFQIQPRLATVSILLPYITRARLLETSLDTPGCLVTTATQGIDIYYSNMTDTSNIRYRFSIDPFFYPSKYVKFDLDGTSYTISSMTYLSPNLFTEYVNGAGNNDVARETYDNYVLVYYSQQPYFLYTLNSQVSNVTASIVNTTTSSPAMASAFFCIQGQFYACIADKLYSCIYDNGTISSLEAIVDIPSLIYLGNNPSIAYFLDPRRWVIKSFTGDAILQDMWDASKLRNKAIVNGYWYDATTQTVYVAFEGVGLFCIGDKNTYLIEDWQNVTNMQFTDDAISHITNNDKTIDFVYYPEDGYEPKAIDAQTSFYGLGDTSSTSIDRWNITLYDQSKTHPTTTVKLCVRSITDIATKAEEKTFKITPEMYDKWSHSILLAYNPKLIKGQGLRLEIQTDLTIQSIIPHIQDNNSGTSTRHGV